MSTSKVVFGFLAGAAVGSILGILYAPDKGTETRRKISDSSNDLAESLKSKFGEYVDSVKDTYQNVKENLADTYQGVKDNAQDLVDKGAAKMNTFKGEVKNEADNYQ